MQIDGKAKNNLTKKILPQHDFIYERLPERWEEGIPLGNGNMGIMLWGNGKMLYGTLDKNDLWETRNKPHDDTEYNYQTLRRLVAGGNDKEIDRIFNHNPSKTFKEDHHPHVTRIPLPKVALDLGRTCTGFTARLHLHDVEMTGKIVFEKKTLAWSGYLHADLNLFRLEIEWPKDWPLPKAAIDIASFDRTINHWGETTINTIYKRWGYPPAEVETTESRQVYYQARPGQSDYAIGCETRRDKGKVRIAVAISSAWDAAHPRERVKELLEMALTSSPGGLDKSHQAFWHGFWSKSCLSIPDARMENLFYANLYFMACNEREGKIPCALQGVWTCGDKMPPWCGEYACNVNVQEQYWPIYTSNHLDSGLPLYDQMWQNLPYFKERCRRFFGFEGAHCTGGMGPHGEPVHGYSTCDFWPGTGPWLAHHFWLHWLYSQDKDFLRDRAFPFMRPFLQTYLNLVEQGEDGKYHLPLSHSPEIGEDRLVAWQRDTTCDIYLIRFLAAASLETVKILGINDPAAAKWRDLLDNLTPPHQNEALGLFTNDADPGQAPFIDPVFPHRHHSHLMGIHPLGNLNVEGTEQERKLIEKSMYTIRRGTTGNWVGFSFPWMSLIASRVQNGNMVWHMLQNYFYFITPSALNINGDPRKFGVTLFDYDPMTLEGGFGYAAAVMEMLLQSWGGIIRVFPAVPEFWHDAYFRTLRAEGAFLVTARRAEGKTVFMEIMSEKGVKCRVKNPFEGEVDLTDLQTGKATRKKGAVVTFETRVGGKYRLTPAGKTLKPANLAPWTPGRRAEDQHWFGLKLLPRF